MQHHRHAVAGEADVDLHVVGAELRRAADAGEAVLGSVAGDVRWAMITGGIAER